MMRSKGFSLLEGSDEGGGVEEERAVWESSVPTTDPAEKLLRIPSLEGGRGWEGEGGRGGGRGGGGEKGSEGRREREGREEGREKGRGGGGGREGGRKGGKEEEGGREGGRRAQDEISGQGIGW